MHEDQTSFLFQSERSPQVDWLQLHRIIEDRGSKYSVTVGRVCRGEDVEVFLKRLFEDKKYRKATHNTYAFRLAQGNRIVDSKNDDGETGAGMAILRVLHRNNLVNTIVVVTRWYGGVKLYGDRFKHVVDAAQEGVDGVC